MKNLSLLVIALFVLSASLVGCESDDGDQAAEEASAAVEAETEDESPRAEEEEEPSELVLQARELGPLAEMIRQDPDSLEGWLEEREMSEEELEELLFDISQDAEASEAYSAAR